VKRSADLPMTIRPVLAFEDEYPAGFVDPVHSHERSQICYAASGVMSFTTDAASFVLPPKRAIWIPAGIPHQLSCRGPVCFKTLYLDPALDRQPGHCRVFDLSALTQALIMEVASFRHAYDVKGREGRIVALLLDEIERMPGLPMQVAMPDDPRLRRVCDAILADTADQRPIDYWAQMAGMGRRTFTRLFRQHTGMGFARWRQQVRVMEAMSLLASGRPITTIAYDVGYESSSAFTAMFHRTLGVPPSAFVRR
jgi:AraC-like DNA-binding protein